MVSHKLQQNDLRRVRSSEIPKFNSKQKFALIGYPLDHSFSPKIHSIAYQIGNIEAEYEKIEIIPNEFEKRILLLKKQNISGLNITVPFKTKIIPFLDKLDSEAKIVGAVNTVKIVNRLWYGYNTDIEGFLSPIKNKNQNISNCLLIGSGGAARAVVYGLIKYIQPEKLIIAARNKQAAYNLQLHFSQINDKSKIEIKPLDSLEKYISDSDLIINTTPLGMYPNINTSPLAEIYELRPGTIIYDLVYNPPQTKFLSDALKCCRDCTIINGMEMLVVQALASIKIWTDILISKDKVLSSLNK